jgi:hypothetical protein
MFLDLYIQQLKVWYVPFKGAFNDLSRLLVGEVSSETDV